uniref:Uncharacterized protein n=1 Tax=Oryza nivara TaxID=4536 RepID=A0A0E0GC28_ORYNI
MPPMFRWWIRIGRRTTAIGIPSESLAQVFEPTMTTSSGVVTLLGVLLRRKPSPVLWTDDDGVFGIATFVRASFLSLRIVVVLLARWRSVSHSDGRFGAWLPCL